MVFPGMYLAESPESRKAHTFGGLPGGGEGMCSSVPPASGLCAPRPRHACGSQLRPASA